MAIMAWCATRWLGRGTTVRKPETKLEPPPHLIRDRRANRSQHRGWSDPLAPGTDMIIQPEGEQHNEATSAAVRFYCRTSLL